MLSINISETIWTVINFFLLMFLLKRFLYTPIIRLLDERKARLDAGLEAERKAKETVEENRMRLDAETAETRKEADLLLSESRAADERRSAEMIAEAQKQAEAGLKAFQDGYEEKYEQELSAISSHRQELSSLLASRLLGQEE